MMAKAHVTVGMAAAFTIIAPHTVQEALPVVAGASIGCLICDIDSESKTEKTESSRWRIVMLIVAAAALIEDHLLDAGMWRSLSEGSPYLRFAGMAGFALVCTFASVSSHRGFSHSLLALAAMTLCLWLVFPAAAPPFAIAFASHQILDLTNKRSVRLFYPAKKGVCLGWFYADRLADRICAAAGAVWLLLICLRLF